MTKKASIESSDVNHASARDWADEGSSIAVMAPGKACKTIFFNVLAVSAVGAMVGTLIDGATVPAEGGRRSVGLRGAKVGLGTEFAALARLASEDLTIT